jgi:CRISPR-associated protein Cas1
MNLPRPHVTATGNPITLYVCQQGALLRRTHGRLIVERQGETLARVRLRDLERVVLCGSVQLSASALAALLDAGIETVVLSPTGRYRGRLTPAEGKNVFLRQTQYLRYEDMAFRLRIAKRIVAGKIRNSRSIVQRHHRNHPDSALQAAVTELERAQARLPGKQTLDEIMGVEGEAARTYFAAMGRMVRSEFAFTGRSRRPPQDPVNALLSFGYTVLQGELTGAVAAQGLDPHVGCLHSLDYGRPSLALDLLEEFRQPVIDRLALSLINRGALKWGQFEDRKEGGVYLNDEGRPRFLEFYHRTMDAEFEDRPSGNRASYRGLIFRQARRFRITLEEAGDYEPYEAR